MEAFSALLLCTEPAPLSIVQKTLEEYGVSVRTVDSAAAAVQLSKANKFDLGVYDADIAGAMELAAGCSQGTSLEIEFQLPELREKMQVVGNGMWTRASGRTGVKFGNIAPTELKVLTTWLDSLMSDQVESIPKPGPLMRQERLLESTL